MVAVSEVDWMLVVCWLLWMGDGLVDMSIVVDNQQLIIILTNNSTLHLHMRHLHNLLNLIPQSLLAASLPKHPLTNISQ